MNQLPEQGQLQTLTIDTQYTANPLGLYQKLCKDRLNTLLLESAEIDSKAGLHSLILVDAAARLTCLGQRVDIEALSHNGEGVLALLDQYLPVDIERVTNTARQLILNFPEVDQAVEEDERLKDLNPLSTLRALVEQYEALHPIREALFIGGVIAYDFIANFESLPNVPAGDNHCPDFVFYIAETLLNLDHQKRQARLLGTLFGSDSASQCYFELSRRLGEIKAQCEQVNTFQNQAQPQPLQLHVNVSDAEFCQQVETLKENVRAGDIFQVVPSRTFSLACPEPLSAYAELKKRNPSPYMFYQQDQDFVLFGASPESALKFTAETRDVEVYPIAGTRRRGFDASGQLDADLDSRIELELRQDKKELAEHLMLVDLARNDIARIAEPGSRYVADLLKVDRYSHVMHLVSRVVGKLRTDLDALHAYQACMNMGTLVGAPKIRAAELIRQTENQRRGTYGGAVGYLTGEGDIDTCIVIRSAYVRDGVAYIQAGAGVVYDSNPQAEADETRSKAMAVLSAIAGAHQQDIQVLIKNEKLGGAHV